MTHYILQPVLQMSQVSFIFSTQVGGFFTQLIVWMSWTLTEWWGERYKMTSKGGKKGTSGLWSPFTLLKCEIYIITTSEYHHSCLQRSTGFGNVSDERLSVVTTASTPFGSLTTGFSHSPLARSPSLQLHQAVCHCCHLSDIGRTDIHCGSTGEVANTEPRLTPWQTETKTWQFIPVAFQATFPTLTTNNEVNSFIYPSYNDEQKDSNMEKTKQNHYLKENHVLYWVVRGTQLYCMWLHYHSEQSKSAMNPIIFLIHHNDEAMSESRTKTSTQHKLEQSSYLCINTASVLH